MELIWGAVGIALAAVGLVELARVGLFWLLRPRQPGSAALVLLPRDGEDCEALIRGGGGPPPVDGLARLPAGVPQPGGGPQRGGHLPTFFSGGIPNLELCKRRNWCMIKRMRTS